MISVKAFEDLTYCWLWQWYLFHQEDMRSLMKLKHGLTMI